MAISPALVKKGRETADLPWAALHSIALVTWLAVGFYILTLQHWSFDANNGIILSNPEAWAAEMAACQGAGGRRLSAAEQARMLEEAGDFAMWDIFLERPEVPIVMTLVVMALAVGWIVLLQYASRPIIYLTAILKIALFVVIGISFIRLNADVVPIAFSFICAGFFAFILWKFRASYDLSARIMTVSCEHLRCGSASGTQVWLMTVLVKVFYLLLLFLYTFFMMRANQAIVVEPLTCGIASPEGMGEMRWVLTIGFIWTTFVAKNIKLVVTATSVANWYFPASDQLENGAAAGLKTAFTTSHGTACFAALITTLAETVRKTATGRWWWTNPWACVLKAMYCCFMTCLEAITRYAMIVHVLTAKPFCDSVKDTYDLIKRRFCGALVVDSAGHDTLVLGAYVFSLAVGFSAWAWIDSNHGWDTLGHVPTPDMEWLVYVVLVFYAILSYYPMVAIFVVVIAAQYVTGPVHGDVAPYTAPLAAIFVASISHIIFAYMAEIILDAMNTVFICYAVEKDAGAAAQQRFQGGEEALYVIMDATPAMQDFSKGETASATEMTGVVMVANPATPAAFAPPGAQV